MQVLFSKNFREIFLVQPGNKHELVRFILMHRSKEDIIFFIERIVPDLLETHLSKQVLISSERVEVLVVGEP